MFKNLIAVFLLVLCGTVSAQDQPAPVELKAPIANTYEASAEHPFGQKNPKAPPEAGQFDFAIGEFECVDELRNPADGTWYKSKGIWRFSYFLNGLAVEDRYWSPIMVAMSTRYYDADNKKWIVTFLRTQPSNGSGTWEGEKEGGLMVMRQKTGNVESRLTFYNISKDGFDWKGERVDGESISSGWKISCKRKL